MNVLTDILCDTSSMMAPQCYEVVMSQSELNHHNISSNQGPLNLLDSVPRMSSLERSLNHSSPSEINLFDSASQIHIPSNLDSTFEERSNVSVFSDSFPEIVPSWLTHDFMKASDSLSSPNILSNVADIYSTNSEPNHLEMLDLGFPPDLNTHNISSNLNPNCDVSNQKILVDLPMQRFSNSELTSHNVSNNLNPSCDINGQKILADLPVQRFSNSDSLILPSFNMNNAEFHISMNKPNMQQHNFKQNNTGMGHPQSLINSVLHCHNDLLQIPLPTNLTEQCLSSSSPSLISSSQSQSHVVCDKLPQISLNHLDSLLGNETPLSDIHLLRHNFPDVRLGEGHSNSHSVVEPYPTNGNLLTSMIPQDIPRLPHSKDVAVQVFSEAPTVNTFASPNCFSCNHVDSELSFDVVQCFKCKFCDYISIHKCSVASHTNASHSRMPPKNVVESGRSLNVGQSFENSTLVSVGGSNESHFNSNNVIPAAADITDLNKQSTLLSKNDHIQEPATIMALNNRKILPKKKDDLKKISLQRKNLNKKTDNNLATKKSSNETSSDKNVKNLSSHKKAWQRKMTRELGTYICETKGCRVCFQSIENLEYHKKCHGDGIRTFVCPECSANFFNWGAIAGHLWRTHGNDMELHKCDQCPFRTFSLSRLENIHKRIHGDECLFLCDTCGKNFKNGKQLRNHRVIHTKPKVKDKRVQCGACKYFFLDKRSLRRHEETVHLKIKPFLCKFCDYSASKKYSLQMHMRSHTGERPFKCDQCDYRSTDHNTLRRHKMIHSGHKPYKCPLCAYSCNQASRFKDHLRAMHPDQNSGLIFSCNICSFKTIKGDMYARHMCVHVNRSPGENSAPEIPATDDIFPLAEAMDISLSQTDILLSNFNKHKNIQSFFNNLNVNMVTVGHQGAKYFYG